MDEYEYFIGADSRLYVRLESQEVYINSGGYEGVSVSFDNLLELIRVLKEIAEKKGLSDES